MSDDLTDRLRIAASYRWPQSKAALHAEVNAKLLLDQAADRIEELKAENEYLMKLVPDDLLVVGDG